MYKLLLGFMALVFAYTSQAQEENTTKEVLFSYEKIRDGNGKIFLQIEARPASNGIQLVGITKGKTDAWINSSIIIDSLALKGKYESWQQVGAVTAYNQDGIEAETTTEKFVWQLPLLLQTNDSIKIKGSIEYFYIKAGAPKFNTEEFTQYVVYNNIIDNNKANGAGGNITANVSAKKSPLMLLLEGILIGLLALLTPCIYSMVPITVNMFTKRSGTKQQGIKNAFVYALSIILIFTLLGTIISATLGDAFFNKLSTNWIANLFFFALFMVFGVSFLGAFEITLPSKWSTAADSKANLKSYSGIFFMALTLVIVSFSCTLPFVGGLAAEAQKGGFIGPIFGFLGFGIGLATPFFILALLPQYLSSLAKSGGWQNALKVTLGIIEIAMAMKFLSNADVSKNWGLLNRDVYLALWIALFGSLSFYLFGKLKFKHDDELPKNDWGLPYLSVTRYSFAVAALAFTMYLIPGLWGAELKPISGLLPAYGTQAYTGVGSGAAHASTSSNSLAAAPVKYVDRLKAQHPKVVKEQGLIIYHDYDEAMAAAKVLNRPLLIDFTGINCANCRKFEAENWDDPTVVDYMKNKFVVASLFTDLDDDDLPEQEYFESELLNKKVTTVGDKFRHLQKKLNDGVLAQPAYIFISPTGKKLLPESYGYTGKGPGDFVVQMNKALAANASAN
jgi:thiol:disulfide interchange protein